jgi:hypothetical protein
MPGYWQTMAGITIPAVERFSSTLEKNKKDEEEKARQARLDAMTSETYKQNITKGQQDIQKTTDEKAKVDAFNKKIIELTSRQAAATSPEAQKEAATNAEIANWDTIHAAPDSSSRRLLGGGVETAAREKAAKPDYVKQFAESNEALAPFGDLDKTYLGGKKDLADKQIQSETANALNAATNAQRDEERKQRAEENEKNRQNLREVAKIRGENRGIYSNLDEEEMQALNNALSEGRIDPYKVNSRTAKIFANQEMLKPGTDWNAIGANTAFQRGTGTMNTKALLNAVAPTIDNLSNVGHELKNTMYPGVNKVVNFFKEQAGNPKVVAFNNARDDAVAEVERGLMGTGVLSDSKYLRAVKNVNTAQSPEQLDAALNQMRFVIEQRLEALQKGPNYNAFKKDKGGEVAQSPSGEHPQDSEAVQWAKKNPNDPRSKKILQLNGL